MLPKPIPKRMLKSHKQNLYSTDSYGVVKFFQLISTKRRATHIEILKGLLFVTQIDVAISVFSSLGCLLFENVVNNSTFKKLVRQLSEMAKHYLTNPQIRIKSCHGEFCMNLVPMTLNQTKLKTQSCNCRKIRTGENYGNSLSPKKYFVKSTLYLVNSHAKTASSRLYLCSDIGTFRGTNIRTFQ